MAELTGKIAVEESNIKDEIYLFYKEMGIVVILCYI